MLKVIKNILLFASFFLSLSVHAMGASTQGVNTPSQYVVYRAQANNRIDPRLRHIPSSSRKANKCLQYTMGVCTLTEPVTFGRVRYNNAYRANQKSTTQMGFQSEQYWNN